MRLSDIKQSDDNKAESNSFDNLPMGAKLLLNNLVKDYQGKSQQQIMDDIVAIAKKNKSEGKLTDSDINNFFAILEPMLNGEQKEMFKKLRESL